jgi:hypothetical protein
VTHSIIRLRSLLGQSVDGSFFPTIQFNAATRYTTWYAAKEQKKVTPKKRLAIWQIKKTI